MLVGQRLAWMSYLLSRVSVFGKADDVEALWITQRLPPLRPAAAHAHPVRQPHVS
jgi:hypothetical protein